jgi:hypothetical protein
VESVFHPKCDQNGQVAEMSDFPADVQEAAAGFTEMQAKAGKR